MDRIPGPAERVVDGRPLRAYCLHQGGPEAPIAALVHGLEGGWDDWRPLCQGGFRQFSVFSLDLPWNGQEGYYWCYPRPAHEWLHLALELLPKPPALLVAHSYGVNVVMEYLERTEVRDLAALVLISTFYRRACAADDWMLFEKTLRNFRAIFEEGITLRRGRALEPELLAAMVDKVLDHVGPIGFMECFSRFLRTPMLDLDRIRVPALVFAGEHDPGATPADNEALAMRLPAGRFEMIPGCGHFCMIQRPDAVERSVRQFLMQHCPGLLGSPAAISET